MRIEVSEKNNRRGPLLSTLLAVGICGLASAAVIACSTQQGSSNNSSAAPKDSTAKVSTQRVSDQAVAKSAATAVIDFELTELSGKPV